ncbi:MAG TPA: SprT family zinc-dependent metalloprotease [Nitrososphaeraceae archaeon]|nr:SprT family zinc-dependent metalloprotease [Nitrososphaeraceae archaeon]
MDKKHHIQQFSKQSFQYGNKIINYTLIRSKRRKTSDITVDQNEIVLRVPFDKSKSDIENILLDKAKWISSKQKEFDQRKTEIIIPTFQDKSTLPYLGINYELRIYTSNNVNESNSFGLKDSKFIAYIQEKELGQSDPNLIRKLYIDWLSVAANKIFKDKVDEHSKTVGVYPTSIVIKNLRNRWGSLSKNGSINLNINLVKATDEVIDYIIIHELCHFKIKGHSYLFWDYLKQFVPDYPRKVEWLEVNSNSLI